MNDLLELAERCEKATGPDREIDGDIAAALSLQPEWATVRSSRQPELFSDTGPGLRARTWVAPKFTASLDAALSLAPEGWAWMHGCAPGEAFFASLAVMDDDLRAPEVDVTAATAPLALCAAALRARAGQPA